MKLATFEVAGEAGTSRRIGSVDGDELVDLTASYAAMLEGDGHPQPDALAETVVPPDMLELLRGEEDSMAAAREAADFAAEADVERDPNGAQLRYAQDAVRLLSPLPRPNTLRDFAAFEEHVRNGYASYDLDIPDEWYEIPASYKGNPDGVVHPDSVVDWPDYTEQFDYELELAAVVGKRGRDVPAEEAEAYLAGYTIFNDFSARDIQATEMAVRFGPSKGKDFANGLGPYLVTPDEFDPSDAAMTARINGEVWSEGNSGEMYHSFGEMVEFLSWDQPIHPGDVYGSGTVPFGCGKGLDRWIEPGDVIELEAEGIGVLRHTVGEP